MTGKELQPRIPVGRTAGEAAELITRSVISHAAGIAEACRATAILVSAEALSGRDVPVKEGRKIRLIYVVRSESVQQQYEERGLAVLRVPEVPLTRMGQIKLAVFRAVSRGLLALGDTVVCLAGADATGTLDNIQVMFIGEELEMFAGHHRDGLLPEHVSPEVVERVIDIACELGGTGREGRPVGALFVVGDAERVVSLSKPMILNPFHGYPEEQRNLQDPGLEGTVRELATIDGAFVIRGDGVVVACGMHLRLPAGSEQSLPHGYGTRHHAAAAITALSESIAVAVSSSAGTVTIFRRGAILTTIRRPRQSVAATLPINESHDDVETGPCSV
ncbi:MAG: diadenylate cyclase [Planctomycetaceae bacterium]|nr:diadenylate cyclase [Planctomycetaceae bacterium]